MLGLMGRLDTQESHIGSRKTLVGHVSNVGKAGVARQGPSTDFRLEAGLRRPGDVPTSVAEFRQIPKRVAPMFEGLLEECVPTIQASHCPVLEDGDGLGEIVIT